MDPVRIMLRFHSLFYAPHFVAMHLGVFAQQDLAVEVRTARSGGELASALLNGEIELGLSGPIRGLDLAERDSPDRIISIIQVTDRDGFFVVGRGPQPRFQWADLMGSRLLLFAEAETPWLCLQHVLRNYGIDIGSVTLITGVPTEQAVPMFLRGEADYLEQGQPAVERLVHSGRGSVVASEGEAVGAIPFSAYLTTPAYAASHAEILQRFTTAYYQAQQWVARHPAEEISNLIGPSFPEIEPEIRTRAIRRYLEQETWSRDPLLREEGFNYLQDILIGGGFLRQRHPYAEHVNVEFARAAMSP